MCMTEKVSQVRRLGAGTLVRAYTSHPRENTSYMIRPVCQSVTGKSPDWLEA